MLGQMKMLEGKYHLTIVNGLVKIRALPPERYPSTWKWDSWCLRRRCSQHHAHLRPTKLPPNTVTAAQKKAVQGSSVQKTTPEMFVVVPSLRQ